MCNGTERDKMGTITDTSVTIGGKTYTLSGYESAQYLQTVAEYLNGKIDEVRSQENYTKIPLDLRNTMLELNIADDYFKARREIEDLKKQVSQREKELFDMKHELVAVSMKLDALERKVKQGELENG